MKPLKYYINYKLIAISSFSLCLGNLLQKRKATKAERGGCFDNNNERKGLDLLRIQVL